MGRPVFKKIDGEERFLFVKEGTSTWSIRSSLTASEALIESGRATNSPTSTQAGLRLRDGSNLVDMSLTCKLDGQNEDGDNAT